MSERADLGVVDEETADNFFPVDATSAPPPEIKIETKATISPLGKR